MDCGGRNNLCTSDRWPHVGASGRGGEGADSEAGADAGGSADFAGEKRIEGWRFQSDQSAGRQGKLSPPVTVDVKHSRQEGVSMNQYCVYLLSKNDAMEKA